MSKIKIENVEIITELFQNMAQLIIAKFSFNFIL